MDSLEKNTHEILQKLLATEEFFESLGTGSGILGPVDESAISVLTAALAEELDKQNLHTRVWLTHPEPRVRQQLNNAFQLWKQTCHYYPNQLKSIGHAELDDPDNAATRLSIVQLLAQPAQQTEVILLSPEALREQAPGIDVIQQFSLKIQVSQELDLDHFFNSLAEHGYEKAPQVIERGQWTQRGGIIDVFPTHATYPVRIELFDTEIESIREFDIHSQTSRRKLQQTELLLGEPSYTATLMDYLREDDIFISCGESADPKATLHFSNGPAIDHKGEYDYSTAAQASPLQQFSAGDFVMQENQRLRFISQIKSWQDEGWSTYLFFSSDGEFERFKELLGEDFCGNYGVQPMLGDLELGCCFPAAKVSLLCSSQLFGKTATVTNRNSQLYQHRRVQAQTDLADIQPGDLVVHNEYGIGRFKEIALDENDLEEIHIRFRDSVILSVPIDQSHLIARYVGMGGKEPPLTKIGDGKWAKSRKSAEKAILDYAAQLLKVQAERHGRPGAPHQPDGKWMWEFESSFPYKETQGQSDAIEEVKADMESNKPMDRLVCGDVGFGKTEVAIRAVFKAVAGGRQAAVLVPTTVLAEQHWRNFQQRMSHFPFRIELLNRFRKPSEVRATLEGLANGSVDIVVGTHRLVSDDVAFKNLGLVVIDEEQRFGVKHKEKFKQRFSQIDVLTLSATPIPRTLYLSLMGARDMSTIDTPPPNKVPIETSICGYDERLIRDAIKRELDRGGQVFFLHNRVQTIEMIKKRLNDLLPDANIVIGHGQMEKNDLETVMTQFVSGKADILLATTIIESGIDIPNANTIIIDRADRFGLADLYQLRGRVGRAGRKAYAILLLPSDRVQGDAKRRIEAIQQYTALGSGFKIAMRDLEIRGAGNLLGTKQSGHISNVGFDLYCQLLKQSIDRLRGEAPLQRVDVALRADFLYFNEGLEKSDALPCYIPAQYMPEASMRIQAYKRLAAANNNKELKALKKEWRDRYGKLPNPCHFLLQTARLKLAAAQANISSIELKGQKLILTRNGEFITLEGKRFPRLTESDPELKLSESIAMLRSI